MSNTLVPFLDKNSFALKDQLKEICGGKAKFDGEKKCWMVPQGALIELKRLSDELNNKSDSKEVWKKACTQCGHRFVRKGTPEYEEVITVFKKLMKENEEKKEDKEEEEYDEDDVVFD